MPARRAVGVDGKEHGKCYLTTQTADAADNPDYAQLPLRTHRQIIKDVTAIRACTSVGSKEAMQVEKGINNQSVFSIIGSINFPWSFTADIMHIIYENIMKEMLGIWEGKYKADMITGNMKGRLGAVVGENYVISPEHWKAIDREVAASNSTVPAALSRRMGSISKRGYWTAEMGKVPDLHALSACLQIHQIMCSIDHPEAVARWRHIVTGFKDLWSDSAEGEEMNTFSEGAPEGLGTLFEQEVVSSPGPSKHVCAAVGAFLSAREWSPAAQRSGNVSKYSWRQIMKPDLNMCSWKGYRTSGARGSQYQTFEDPNPRNHRRELREEDWIMMPTYGQILEFLSFCWKGEDIWVAVIQVWEKENWLKDQEPGCGPQLKIAMKAGLQAVEVSALEAMVGRIKMWDGATEIEVMFETSDGCLAPEMF
ncbi:hypothetical protein QFC21_006184 [Naganishia friedmannii]|uniref:Uncharacterized protein n=1 Tax=Naganishia friedmannii TaxID=89922 RepID=A0ACC2V4N9_9TREE|nr:hypothetical protein QFC21_006184 [Naganishia friedmannii]